MKNVDLTQVHYLSGPIAIPTAKKGDLLKVELLNLGPLPGDEWGFTGTFHKDNGGGFLTDHYPEATKACWDLEGIFAVQPISRSWTYDGPELKGQYVNVTRRQLPLGPARVLPLYSMQGMTAEPGLVAHWTFPPRLDYDIKWLICYVILSRVPSLPQLMSIGLSDKIRAIIEGGPPDNLVQAFNTLFQDKAEQTLAAALEARRRLGW